MHLDVDKIHWGDAPTWVAAIAAVVAGVYAVRTYRSQNKQLEEQATFIARQSEILQLEHLELRAAAAERREQQAREVEVSARLTQSVNIGDSATRPGAWVVTAHNRSRGPIHQVRVVYGDTLEATVVSQVSPERPRVGVGRGHVSQPVMTVDPGEMYSFNLTGVPDATLLSQRPVLYFVDDNGVSWSVDEHQSLREVLLRTE